MTRSDEWGAVRPGKRERESECENEGTGEEAVWQRLGGRKSRMLENYSDMKLIARRIASKKPI